MKTKRLLFTGRPLFVSVQFTKKIKIILIPILVVFPQLLSGRNRRNVPANMPSISVCLVFVMFEYS